MKNCTTLLRTLPFVIFTFSLFIAIHSAHAQGGPPMLTDDSGVPGAGKWENNFGLEFVGSKNDYSKNFPITDFNYGVGDRIQLKFELTWVAGKGENLANKIDNITMGFKYRIIDGKEDELSLSVYPEPIISFNSDEPGKDIALGIVLPVAINKEIAGFGTNFQAGYQILGKNSELFFGLCIDHDFGKHLTLLTEIHTTIGRSPDIDATGEDETYFKAGTFLNVGAVIKLSENYNILMGIGKDLESPGFSSDDANFYGYIGFQFLM